MILLALNLSVKENYAFYDPSAPIELTLSNQRGFAPRLTESIIRGLRAKTLIDVENKIDIEKGIIKNGEEQKQEKREEETKKLVLEEKLAPKEVIEPKVETKVEEKTKSKKKK